MKAPPQVLAMVAVTLAGCGGGAAPRAMNPEVTREEREQMRQSLFLAMISEESCYLKSLDYAVRDREFLDRVLKRMLTGRTLDEVIAGDRQFTSSGGNYEVARMLREAPESYAKELRTEDGIARLEKLIAERFAHPKVEMQWNVVLVTYGHVAAKLKPVDHNRIVIDFPASEHLDPNREWRSQEIATALKYQLEMHPAADGVQLRVLIPGSREDETEWRYEYRRTTDRVKIVFGWRELPGFLSEPVGHDFGPYINGEKGLSSTRMAATKAER